MSMWIENQIIIWYNYDSTIKQTKNNSNTIPHFTGTYIDHGIRCDPEHGCSLVNDLDFRGNFRRAVKLLQLRQHTL